MEAAIALAAAKKGVDRAVDLVIDTGLAAVVYVYNMWSAYGALSGDAQDIANYVDYVGGLREKVLKSNKVRMIPTPHLQQRSCHVQFCWPKTMSMYLCQSQQSCPLDLLGFLKPSVVFDLATLRQRNTDTNLQ